MTTSDGAPEDVTPSTPQTWWCPVCRARGLVEPTRTPAEVHAIVQPGCLGLPVIDRPDARRRRNPRRNRGPSAARRRSARARRTPARTSNQPSGGAPGRPAKPGAPDE